jgi:nucleotide-binding universal stress UspA family protein
MFTNILLAVDGSEASQLAARHGIALASHLKARIVALTVTVPWAAYFSRELAVLVPDIIVPELEYDRKRDAAAERVLQSVVADARGAGVAAKSLHRSDRDPYKAIVDVARSERCDLIVMGSHCDQGMSNSLLGSETMKVLAHTGIPVLIYRQN